MSEAAEKPPRLQRKPLSPLRLPSSPPDGYRHPAYPALVWRGNNWVIEGRGASFCIADEIEDTRRRR